MDNAIHIVPQFNGDIEYASGALRDYFLLELTFGVVFVAGGLGLFDTVMEG